MRWLKKREIIIYFLLYKKFETEKFNIGEAIQVLSPYFSKKVSINVIRYLTKVGLVIKLNETEYRLLSMEEYLLEISVSYIRRRATLHHKTQ
ncbi:hypothetical protein [Sulfolobus acidocaldarius]|uniref:Conserved protein n=4 Tax=Sulfolobus acidocaldarius TaxID=2285 RepID=Q4J971_SULAC|nr:hypothetical protein [Sulfolobus acidocaldarius]AAY80659.1 conserved protein [Sulfolobus acidocaldarius DSM 639]AGE71256.1 hypothetical protein SacN8_06455 [Sulfolobus acidocaldarius N8]AGE73525.1 hypothetical protein SacRon12I_06445 [Sulfolobus acidocaldarius Ron12/I]ALU30481.1 hypothetical protein ATY89_11380 [Sulfolobus acidocaldarius]ALU31204.1 hypothetical protein ATZ20_02935 [Sulfolobus acidocaldarius]